jgi:HPt (histidine-containing phosphotransfer) domain-containing protein
MDDDQTPPRDVETPEDSGLLDPAVSEALASDFGADFLESLIASFAAEARAAVEDLGTAARAGDAPAVGRAAHLLRGSAAYLGLSALVAGCESIEEEASAGAVPSAETCEALGACLSRSLEALAGLVARLKGG